MKSLFYIALAEVQHDGSIRAGGRVWRGSVRIGDVAVSVCPAVGYDLDEEAKDRASISVVLRVKKLETYGQELQCLDEGLTGYVFLEGLGGHELGPETILDFTGGGEVMATPDSETA